MKDTSSTAYDLVERIKRKAPEYLDLLTAETDAEFESAFDALLGMAVARLEASKRDLAPLGEVGLSSFLAVALSIPGMVVTQETNSNGHVDLTIEADHCCPPRKKLGEAKIYSGPRYHTQGLEQLLGRYSTGREGRGLLIEYVRKENIATLVRKLRTTMDGERPQKQKGPSVAHSLKWSFITTHTHASGEDLQVGHIGCNLYIE